MSTTRHLINRQRRLAAVAPARVRPSSEAQAAGDLPGAERPRKEPDRPMKGEGRLKGRERAQLADRPETAGPDAGEPEGDARGAGRRVRLIGGARLPAALCVLTVLLGAFAAWAGTHAADLRDNSSADNTALTDVARTTEVKGQVTQAVNALFSYDYADTAKADKAAKSLLTGKAVRQHRDMLKDVRAQAAEQKLVLTTTVTESGVQLIDGNRARVLVFADQSNTRTAAKDDRTAYAGAMFAVDAVRTGGSWKIANIDTFA
ncbi:hypothetical protein [Streptomyces sp. NBC_00344]|uniref:hypothetical protein n=1 Tax=Streptomyces sp. NBC_00344 TaxID=2975720 RepID=UPI002E1BD973